MKRQSAKRKHEAVALAELRLFVLERDGYRCRYCRARNRPLEVDHIEKRSHRPDLLLDPMNCITLCGGPNGCHTWKDNGDPHSPMGRLKYEGSATNGYFWIDREGKLARMAVAVENVLAAGGKGVE